MTMFNKVVKSFKYGDHNVRLETGEIARQASGAVICDMDDTVVLATVVAKKEIKPGQDFFPLTVDYIEKTYAAGRIPGGFFKREGRPSEKETLTSRLIDRPIRPLFPEGFFNEVQIIIHVLSVNPEVDPDIPSMIAASAALAVSGVPFNGPIAAARVGYINNEYVLCPNLSQMKDSKLDLVVAGTERAVLMVESEADQLSEEVMLGAVMFGYEKMQVVIEAIDELVEEAGKPLWDWAPAERNQQLVALINQIVGNRIHEAYEHRSKQDRNECLRAIYDDVNEKLTLLLKSANSLKSVKTKSPTFSLKWKLPTSAARSFPANRVSTAATLALFVRSKSDTGVLPRAHGSALFTRGETQALVVTTLGTKQDEQIVDGLTGEQRERFMLHYNMPPFATGETGRVGSPKRREIGHGRLAKRALTAVLPNEEDFQYTMRVVSEICESNGSSSMASVCGGCLSLLDAGVPLKDFVAGVAMGLIKEGNKFAVLTDILGDEDHLGDMDFKVAGTDHGVTALQMDIKIEGISKEIMQVALAQAKEGRMHILGKMHEAVEGPKTELSPYAPRLVSFKINPDKIRDVIGKGGAVIRALTEETGTQINIEDDGTVTIASVDEAAGAEARRRVEELAATVEVGKVYEGKVQRLLDFGAIVQVLPGRDGLLHISQIAHERVNQVSDYLKEGQTVRVKVLEIDDKDRIRLSMKALIEKPEHKEKKEETGQQEGNPDIIKG